MKQATSEFPLDNGTVFEGQVLPDGHPAVERFPENFRDVTDETDPEVLDGQAVADGATGQKVEPEKDDKPDPDAAKADTSKPSSKPDAKS